MRQFLIAEPILPAYLDPRTGQTFPLAEPRWCGPDRAPLLLTPLPGIGREAIDRACRSLWRYRAALPFAVDDPITLGEGETPLIARTFGGGQALFKCDWMMPTGSFKDRGASVMLSLLRAQGVAWVLEDSSGNGGASVAAYAAAGGMRATILTPAATSPAKLVAMAAHGAAIERVEGSREDTAEAALRRSDEVFYASHNWHPYFLHGTKTLAYELWEELGFRAPANVIVPCGAGSNVLGCGIGFAELRRAGAIDAMPRIFAAQPANCAPVVASFHAGADGPVPTEIRPTIAEGTQIARPVRLAEVIGVLRQTRGGAVGLSEREIGEAVLLLAAQGLYVEPTAAQPAAAYRKLLAAGAIGSAETTVLVLTGAGLKATSRIAALLGIEA